MKFDLKSVESQRFFEHESRKLHYMVRMDSYKDHVPCFSCSFFFREEGKEMFLVSKIFHRSCFISSLRPILLTFNMFNKPVASVFKYTMTSLSESRNGNGKIFTYCRGILCTSMGLRVSLSVV